ncbi:MAG TPA: ribosomal RNA small subunit methyltransferase A [Candidatus Kaiserbacteria bacterium]|nr:ribosomal RNA small subunit methyltransferase A [Candidatus Kaiserbacteria bacterium]
MFAKKSLGQNFLMHKQTAERIVDSANISKDDTVLEIGPGTGMLTTALLAHSGKVIAIEADRGLAEALREKFSKEIANGKLILIDGDALEFDTSSISSKYIVVANIPYYITGALIRKFLETAHKPSSMTLLVQKEVAERIVHSPKESVLSVSVKIYGTPHKVFAVPRGSFKPAPNVDSAVLYITDIRNPFKTKKEATHFFTVLHAGFAHKRKKLAKNIQILGDYDIQKIFKSLNIDIDTRAEKIDSKKWLELATSIHD